MLTFCVFAYISWTWLDPDRLHHCVILAACTVPGVFFIPRNCYACMLIHGLLLLLARLTWAETWPLLLMCNSETCGNSSASGVVLLVEFESWAAQNTRIWWDDKSEDCSCVNVKTNVRIEHIWETKQVKLISRVPDNTITLCMYLLGNALDQPIVARMNKMELVWNLERLSLMMLSQQQVIVLER